MSGAGRDGGGMGGAGGAAGGIGGADAASPGAGGADSGASGGIRGSGGAGLGGLPGDAGAGSGGGDTGGADASTDAPPSTGGRTGTTSPDSGGVSSTGGVSGNDGGSISSGIDGQALSCSEIPGPCTVSTSQATTNYFYNSQGWLIRSETTGSGIQAYTYYYAYDQAGKLSEKKNDACVANRPGECSWTVYSYDSQGNLTVIDDTKSTLDIPSGPGCQRYTYNANNLMVKSEFDPWCDGSVPLTKVSTYDYDGSGRRTAAHGDIAALTSTSVNVSYQYNSANQVVLETYTDKDGSATATIAYTLNAAGLTLTEEDHYLTNESDDRRLTYTYDDKGHQLSRQTLYLTGKKTGKEESCYTRTFDGCGNEVSEKLSALCDQTFTETTYSYACFGG